MKHTDYALRDKSRNTMRVYASQWRKFQTWCDSNDAGALPATPSVVAEYLAAVAESGLKTASVEVARAAIDYAHYEADLPLPGRTRTVRATLSGIKRERGVAKKQSAGLTTSIYARLLIDLDGNQRFAEVLTIIAVMRDAMLRGSELAELRVDDFTPMENGTGRLKIRKSKSDQFGEGAVCYLSADTTARVVKHLIATGRKAGLMFRGEKGGALHTWVLSRRIRQALIIAGIDASKFTSHSPRIGMTQDLSAANIDSAEIARAGRWKSIDMVVYYSRNQSAERGAVARFYGGA